MIYANYDIQTLVSVTFTGTQQHMLVFCTICGCFHMSTAEVSSRHREHTAHRSIYYPDSRVTALAPTPGLQIQQVISLGLWGSSTESARRNHRIVQRRGQNTQFLYLSLPNGKVHPMET